MLYWRFSQFLIVLSYILTIYYAVSGILRPCILFLKSRLFLILYLKTASFFCPLTSSYYCFQSIVSSRKKFSILHKFIVSNQILERMYFHQFLVSFFTILTLYTNIYLFWFSYLRLGLKCKSSDHAHILSTKCMFAWFCFVC